MRWQPSALAEVPFILELSKKPAIVASLVGHARLSIRKSIARRHVAASNMPT
jgi:hypothetical protein